MAKKGIKIKDLAQDLGVTSRQLIDRCRVEGVVFQNSISKVPIATERLIRDWFKPNDGDVGPDVPGEVPTLATRVDAVVVGVKRG